MGQKTRNRLEMDAESVGLVSMWAQHSFGENPVGIAHAEKVALEGIAQMFADKLLLGGLTSDEVRALALQEFDRLTGAEGPRSALNRWVNKKNAVTNLFKRIREIDDAIRAAKRRIFTLEGGLGSASKRLMTQEEVDEVQGLKKRRLELEGVRQRLLEELQEAKERAKEDAD